MKHATKTETETDSLDPTKDFALEAIYAQAVRSAHEFGWPVPSRAEFEVRYREELAAHGLREE